MATGVHCYLGRALGTEVVFPVGLETRLGVFQSSRARHHLPGKPRMEALGVALNLLQRC